MIVLAKSRPILERSFTNTGPLGLACCLYNLYFILFSLSIWFKTQSAYYQMVRKMNLTYVLHSSCKDDDLIDLGHLLKELVAARSNQEGSLAADFKVVDQGFVQIQD